MTKSEKIIFKLFSDLKGITEYMDNYDNLKKVYNTAIALFNKGKYSSINVQDEEGNTFLHYAMKSNNFELSEKILRKGANPFIKNKAGRNCFFMFQEYGAVYRFSEQFKGIRLDDDFSKKTAGFCTEYKQYMLEERAKKAQFFKSVDEVHEFLDNARLLSVENVSRLLSQSLSIKMDDKLSSYMAQYDDKENNSFFFKELAHACANNFKIKNKNLEDKFFKREFADNAAFVKGVCILVLAVKEPEYLRDTMTTIINLMLHRGFDLSRATGASQESIEDFFCSHEFIKEVFLREKLEFVLQKDMPTKIQGPKKI